MNVTNLSVGELLRYGEAGEDDALLELGRRVLRMQTCVENGNLCTHEDALQELQFSLENDIPEECPHCGEWVGDV